MKTDEAVDFSKAASEEFVSAIEQAKSSSSGAKGSGLKELSVYPVKAYDRGSVYLSSDKKSGYAILNGDELVSVFSTEKGRGNDLMKDAIRNGAKRLDFFADLKNGKPTGALHGLYSKHGFKIDTSLNDDGEYPIINGISPVEGEDRAVVYMKR